MTINTKVSGTVLTISPEGRLDSTTSDEFLAFTREHFTTEYDVLAVDCAAVDYISSKGLRVLLTIFKGLGERR
jgi:Anti-anti-sigma regulatory factor (antagonist of anti-sigma factor)